MTIYEYEVTGQGRFPLDMLRYDCAWPRESVTNIETTREDEDYLRPRTVKLASIREPTIGRWASFGWGVYHLTKVKR